MFQSRKRETARVPMHDGGGWMEVSVDPVLDATGNVVSAVHIVRDISDQTRSEKALEQAKKKLNLLNYVTFNELQNSLFTLSAYQQLAQKMAEGSPAAPMIGKEMFILQKLSQTLDFARSYQDLGMKPPRWQNVNQVFLLAISHLDFQEISHEVRTGDLEIFADPLLEQVFQILADNVLAHAKAATRVIIRFIQSDNTVTIFFEDNGTGIPDEIKSRVFLPDFQKQKSAGLFLAREILEITGMTISETGEPGKGARFEIVVPMGIWRNAGSQK